VFPNTPTQIEDLAWLTKPEIPRPIADSRPSASNSLPENSDERKKTRNEVKSKSHMCNEVKSKFHMFCL
jgi:hypothetical protein